MKAGVERETRSFHVDIRSRVLLSLQRTATSSILCYKILSPRTNSIESGMDLDRAFRSLERIKPHVRKWVEQTQRTVDLVQTGELDFSYTYLNRAKAARDAGISMDFSQDQLVVYGSYYVVPKGAPHKDAAMRYLSFL